MFSPKLAGRYWQRQIRPQSEGAGTVALAALAPLAVMALAITADYAKVSHFRNGVQEAANAASVATADAAARQSELALDNVDFAGEVADSVFLGHAPRGAGTPNVALKNSAAAVTATVRYTGFAPSNFGSILGYDTVSAEASSTSLARVADFRATVTR